MLFIDDLFEMSSGYVLNFSDRTIAQFFNDAAQRVRHFRQTREQKYENDQCLQ